MAVGKYVGAGILFMMILALISAGCSSILGTKGGESVPQGPGFSDITPRDDARSLSLAEAIDELRGVNSKWSGNQSLPVNIYYVRGESLDVNGTAQAWTIGAQRDSETFFSVYDGEGSEIIDWNTRLPGQEIDFSKIVPPEDLFAQNRLLIQDVTSGGKITINELELQGNVYTMRVQSGKGTKIFLFDAFTGKKIDE
jgi:hypothetical protein